MKCLSVEDFIDCDLKVFGTNQISINGNPAMTADFLEYIQMVVKSQNDRIKELEVVDAEFHEYKTGYVVFHGDMLPQITSSIRSKKMDCDTHKIIFRLEEIVKEKEDPECSLDHKTISAVWSGVKGFITIKCPECDVVISEVE